MNYSGSFYLAIIACTLTAPLHSALPYQNKPVRVFILSGQSNMAGSGGVNRAPVEWRSQPTVLFDVTSAGASGATSWNSLGTAVSGMGPEIAFGAIISAAYPDDQIAIVKVSAPGTGLSYWRTPGSAGYDTLVSRIDTTKAWLDAAVTNGDIPSWRYEAFLWMQGENEADGALGPSQTYYADFSDLATKVRTRTASAALPVILGRISIQLDPSVGGPVEQPQLDNVRNAQVLWAQQDGHGAWLDTDDLPLVDSFHFGSVGQLLFGQRFAQAWFNLSETRPTVIVTRAAGQPLRRHGSRIYFNATFSAPVTGFTATDVILSAETGTPTATVREITPNDGTTYEIEVTGMQYAGKVRASIPGSAASTSGGLQSLPSMGEDPVVIWSPGQAVADLIAFDSFEAPAASMVNLSSGSGWSGTGWLIQNNAMGYRGRSTSALIYSGLASSPGYGEGGDVYTSCAREFDLESTFRPWMTDRSAGAINLPDTELWVSYLVKPQRNGQPQLVALSRGSGAVGDSQTITLENDAGKWKFTVLGASTTTTVACTTGQSYLCVFQLLIGGANPSTARLWINPLASTLGGANLDPVTAVASHTVTSSDFKFSRLHWYPGSGIGDGLLDEVRIGLTYASVTPSSSPSPDPDYPNDPSAFLTWRQTYFTAAELLDSTISGELADPLHDGIPNKLKFALGYGPREQVVPLAATPGGQGSAFAFTYQHDTSATDYPLIVEVSQDLSTWSRQPDDYVSTATPLAGTLEQVTIRPPTGTTPTRWFVRLVVP
ncbi:MAG: sialate O-acetylesterase [Verrucomicrobiota bacterium]|nr:sialate O-acetylesterase [Verrucomicrobiota bacterium]